VARGANRLRFGVDVNDEEWQHADSGERYTQKTVSLIAEQEYVLKGRKSVSFGVGYLKQSLQFTENTTASGTRHFIAVSAQWNQRQGLNKADTLRLDIQGRYDHAGATQASGFLRLPWDLDSSTSVEVSLRGGASGKRLPLSRYFVLGIGQDDPLPLRAHSTLDAGFKGIGPMGRRFALVNLEMRRRLFETKGFAVTGLVFSDTAAVHSMPFGGRGTIWYQDIGSGVRVGALGKDLLDLRVGVDVKRSSFNLWIGVPQ
jgi:hypothetical protein